MRKQYLLACKDASSQVIYEVNSYFSCFSINHRYHQVLLDWNWRRRIQAVIIGEIFNWGFDCNTKKCSHCTGLWVHIIFSSPRHVIDKSYRICMIIFRQGSKAWMTYCPLVLRPDSWACSVNESLITCFGICQWDGLDQNLKCTNPPISHSVFEFPIKSHMMSYNFIMILVTWCPACYTVCLISVVLIHSESSKTKVTHLVHHLYN